MNEQENKTKITIESEFNKLNVSDNDFNPVNTNHKNCSNCNKPFTEELWCKKCDPYKIIEGWTSGNSDIDKIIKDSMYNAIAITGEEFLEWVPFDRFTDIKQIGEGGFAKVYSATWIDGLDSKSVKVALKKLNGSQEMSVEYLNEVYDNIFYLDI